jgi:hypothetical protein
MWLTEGKKKHKHLASDDRHRVHPFPQRENEKKRRKSISCRRSSLIQLFLVYKQGKEKRKKLDPVYTHLWKKKMLFPIELLFVLLFFIFSSIAVCCDGPNVRRRTFTYREYIKAQRAQMDKNKDKNKRKRETRA